MLEHRTIREATRGAGPRLGTAPWSPRIDVTTFLTLWLVLLFGISAEQVVGPLGAIGSPAALLMLPTLLWWATARVVPALGFHQGPQPIRVAVLVYLWMMAASYVVAISRPLTETEANGALRSLLLVFGVSGVALLITDAIRDVDRLRTLLRRLVLGGAFLALIGILQFLTASTWQPTIPGLTWNHEVGGLGTRSIFLRPQGTAMHPIEMSVVTAALLPLAIHFYLHAAPGRRRFRALAAVGVIGLATPLSLSRSGILVLVVAMAIMAAGWGWRRRANLLLVGLGCVPLLWLMIPGLVGTLIDLFGQAGDDTSVQVRMDRVPRVMAMIGERPWLGLGNGTWSVQDYFLIDNEIYVTTLETGLVGLAVTLGLFAAAVIGGLWVRHLPGADGELAHLGRALSAGIAGVTVSLFTFDAFHYRILSGMLFVMVGAVGAVLRMAAGPREGTGPRVGGLAS